MEVTIRIKKDNGDVVEVIQEISSIDNNDPIVSVEQEVSAIKDIMIPLLSAHLVEQHQLDFQLKKSQKKERL